MRVMLLDAPGLPLHAAALDIPMPGAGQVRLRVLACGVCRTDLHIADGELASAKLPLVLGHQIVGQVDALPDEPSTLRLGDRVGVPWLAGTCGTCRFCADGRENLCELAAFTGYTVDGGFADFAIAQQAYCRKEAPEELLLGVKMPRIESDPDDVGMSVERLLHEKERRALAIPPGTVDSDYEAGGVRASGERVCDAFRERPAIEAVVVLGSHGLI
jgi:hypothetical protein